MSDWEKTQLGELFEIKHGYAFQSQFFSDTGHYVVLTPGYFREEGGFREFKTIKYYAAEILSDYVLAKDDLIVAMTEQAPGLLGSAALVPASDKYLHNQRLGLIVNIQENRLDKVFLYHLFNSPEVRTEISTTASGTKVKHTSPQRIYDVIVPLPPLPEQRKIAAILSTWDEAITLTRRLIEALQQRKRALMDLLLTGQVRFPGFDVELERTQLAELIDLLTGFPFSSEAYIDNPGIKLLRGINITNGQLRWGQSSTKYWVGFENYEPFLLQDEDIVIGMDGSLVGRNFARVSSSDLPALLVQRVARIRAKYPLHQRFLYHQFGNTRFTDYVDSRKTVTAIPHISARDIREFEIYMPSSDEQEVIADLLDMIDFETVTLNRLEALLQAQKRGLMQQLLTGAVRVQGNE